jgi:hypothetical protein
MAYPAEGPGERKTAIQNVFDRRVPSDRSAFCVRRIAESYKGIGDTEGNPDANHVGEFLHKYLDLMSSIGAVQEAMESGSLSASVKAADSLNTHKEAFANLYLNNGIPEGIVEEILRDCDTVFMGCYRELPNMLKKRA